MKVVHLRVGWYLGYRPPQTAQVTTGRPPTVLPQVRDQVTRAASRAQVVAHLQTGDSVHEELAFGVGLAACH